MAGSPTTSPILGTLVYEDLVIAIYLVIASALTLGSGNVNETLRSIAVAVGFILVLVLLVYCGDVFFQRSLETDSNEFIVL